MQEFRLKTILFCEDDNSFRDRLCKAATAHSLEVFEAADVDSAFEIYIKHKPDAVVVDLKMETKSGLHFLKQVNALDSANKCRIVVLTGYGSIQTAIEAVRLGAHNYLTKPASFKSIITAINSEACELEIDPYIPSLQEVETEYVNRVLEHNQGNISKAAKDLGLHRRSLQRKLSS